MNHPRRCLDSGVLLACCIDQEHCRDFIPLFRLYSFSSPVPFFLPSIGGKWLSLKSSYPKVNGPHTCGLPRSNSAPKSFHGTQWSSVTIIPFTCHHCFREYNVFYVFFRGISALYSPTYSKCTSHKKAFFYCIARNIKVIF